MIPCLPGLLGSAGAFADTRWTLDNVQYVDQNDFGIQVEGFALSPDGMYFYFANSDTDSIIQWDLQTPWLLSTAIDNGKSLVMTGDGVTNPKQLSFKPDMSMMYVHHFIPSNPAVLYEYSVSDFTNISLSTITAGTSAQPADTISSTFNSDGTKLRSAHTFSPFEIYSKDMGTPYSLPTAGVVIETASSLIAFPATTHSWSPDKIKLMVAKTANTFIEIYSMTNDDISTLSLTQSLDVSIDNPTFQVSGAFVSPDGKHLYSKDISGTERIVRHYSL